MYMYIKSLSLQNFRNFDRNFEKKSFEFEPLTVIVGANAVGKTNALEAIHLLSTGRSFRANVEQEMIAEDKDVARVEGVLNNEELGDFTLGIVLTRGMLHGNKVSRKKLSVNEVSRGLYRFTGIFKTVLFGPWDLDLVTASPSTRRRFLDGVLSQVDKEYGRSILAYERGLRQRNRLLQQIRDGEARRTQLFFWNQLLVKNGDYITNAREGFFDFINARDQLRDEEFSLEYDRSGISQTRLDQYADQEVAAGATLVGPHRDDFEFKVQSAKGKGGSKRWRGLDAFGSRGEQRMGVLWLKLGELDFVEAKTNTRPVLLLDDIFSELDREHHEIVLTTVGRQQTILTSADPDEIERLEIKGKVISLN